MVVLDRFRRLLQLPAQLDSWMPRIFGQLEDVNVFFRSVESALLRPPASFVSIFAMGQRTHSALNAGLEAYGTAGFVSAQRTFRIEAYRPIVGCQVLVLCDLSRVDVMQMAIGAEIIFAGGAPPVAYFPPSRTWSPGEVVSVTCCPRAP